MPSNKHQPTKEAASELAAVGSMETSRAFDRDMLGRSTGDSLIDNNSIRKEGRSNFSNSACPLDRKIKSSAPVELIRSNVTYLLREHSSEIISDCITCRTSNPPGYVMSERFDAYYKWLAIPPEEQPPNHYRLLGVPLFMDDHDVIEAAADQRMAHLRTYQSGKQTDLSQKLLNEVSAARVNLLNLEKRAEYDAKLKQELGTDLDSPVGSLSDQPGGGTSYPAASGFATESTPTAAAPIVKTKPAIRK